MDLNTTILGRTAVSKKRDAVKSASESDLLRVTEDTIKKMLKKQKPDKYYPNRKTLFFNRVSNNWNADAKSVELYRGKVFINFYVQYSNTDTDECEYLNKFLGSGDYRGAINYEDRYGNGQTAYYRFDRTDKANVVRAILLAYLDNCEKK